MEPINWFMMVVTQHYFDFNGRARRAEFWWFALVFFILFVALGLIDSLFHIGLLADLLVLALLLPSLGLWARRMHDIGRSGWWMLVPIMNIVWAAQEGAKGENTFGPDPKG
jgi:uncharacterized membrane protein YhaH (DUF805 family)